MSERDGLREEAARAIANANNGGLTEHEPDEGDYHLLDKVLRILGLDAVPDVPAADKKAIARVLIEHRAIKPAVCQCGWWSAIGSVDGSDHAGHVADMLRSSGVLVDAADVRARTCDEAADLCERHADASTGEGVAESWWRSVAKALRDRAVSEREGTTS